jgi:hypothetical protein
METALKQLIKEAILEALVEFTNGGVAVAKDDNGLSDENSGGTPGKGNRPKPNVGVGVFGLR